MKLDRIRERVENPLVLISNRNTDAEDRRIINHMNQATSDLADLLDEVDRLRSENEALRHGQGQYKEDQK